LRQGYFVDGADLFLRNKKTGDVINLTTLAITDSGALLISITNMTSYGSTTTTDGQPIYLGWYFDEMSNPPKINIGDVWELQIGVGVSMKQEGNDYYYNAEFITEIVAGGTGGYELFPDVPKDNWAWDYIKDLYSRHIINGYPEGDFRPNGLVTRAEFAKMMFLTLGIDKSHDYSGVIVDRPFFVDVAGDYWAYEYIKYVGRYMTGFQGPDGNVYFKGDDAAVREDMAVALVKAMGLSVSDYSESELASTFSDWQSISTNLRPYVLAAYKNKLIDGYPGGWFGPQKTITRAETAAMLMKVWRSDAMEKVVFD
jgi:hypothetical protein